MGKIGPNEVPGVYFWQMRSNPVEICWSDLACWTGYPHATANAPSNPGHDLTIVYIDCEAYTTVRQVLAEKNQDFEAWGTLSHSCILVS